jgi:hypothetical protein
MPDLTFRTTLAFLAGFSLTGCTLPGQRALHDGACPVGETCSTTTPDGLFFLGATTSDSIFGGGVAITAAGGTQTVTAVTGTGTGSPPFDGDFTAATTAPGVLTVDLVTPPSVVVRGQAGGTSLLRLLAPETGALLDRVEIQVEPISKVSLFPSDLVFLELAAAPDLRNAPWALLSGIGASARIVVRLHGAGDDRLVDEGLALTPAFGAASRGAWDLFEVDTPSPGTVSFSIQAGGASFPVEAQVFDGIDDIVAVPLAFGADPTQVSVSQDALFCCLAQSGGTPVAGAAWNFNGSANLTVKPEPSIGRSCVSVQGKTTGMATLTVTAGGVEKTFDLTVSAKPKQKSARRSAHPAFAATAGERAAISAE